MTNNLINETSPYLLQHKNNPVNWFAWNSKTLKFIKTQKKPILLSIGYSSCHWCHVMAHESFENHNIANIMNSCFINIKVDREERPDLDALYQASLALMGQQGGWPLTMFLDNNLKPFWGGTYFPDISKHGMPAFPDVLNHIHNVYSKNKDQVFNNSKSISDALKKIHHSKTNEDYSISDIITFINSIDKHFDTINGGLIGSPKFPMAPLLRAVTYICGLDNKISPSSLKNIKTTLDSLCLGGIYDHLGGGFSRYSTDVYWLVPHFEKMLYDNAQLIEILSSFSHISNSPLYLNRVRKTISWLRSEMLYSKNGFEAYFSAMDADSGGKEGEYYVWDYGEIKDVLLGGSESFFNHYGVEKNGNWEGKNILHRINKNKDLDIFFESSKDNISNIEKLLKKRLIRVLPSVDYKILTDWNSMLICGLLKTYGATENLDYLNMSQKIYSFIINNHFVENELYHSSCNGKLGNSALLDDYANFIKACFLLYEADEDINKLKKARELIQLVKKNFFDTLVSDFYFSNKKEGDLFLKTTNKLDGPTQAGSSIMLENLIKNYYYFGDNKDLDMVDLLIRGSWSGVKKNLISGAGYILAAYMKTAGYNFVALIKKDVFGKDLKKYLLKLSSFSVLTFFYNEEDVPQNSVIGKKRFINGGSTVYVCKGFVCSEPFINIKQLKIWIKNNMQKI